MRWSVDVTWQRIFAALLAAVKKAAQWQDTLRENRPRPTRLDLYKPYLKRRFAAGCTSVTCLHRELLAEKARWRRRRR
ncbi:hypothetical protein ACWC0C_42510 [Streptomyces sp. NPDC001709]